MNHFWQGFEKSASTRWGRELADSLGKSVGIDGVTPKILSLGRKLNRTKFRPKTPYRFRREGTKHSKGLAPKIPDTAFKPDNLDRLRNHVATRGRLPIGAPKLPELYNRAVYKMRPKTSFAESARDRVEKLLDQKRSPSTIKNVKRKTK